MEGSSVMKNIAFYIRQFQVLLNPQAEHAALSSRLVVTRFSFGPLFRVQRALVTQLSGAEDDFNSKEAQLLLSILGVLSGQLEPSSPQVRLWNCTGMVLEQHM